MPKSNGEWKTIKGNHVLIGSDGTIQKGPKSITGKKVSELKGTPKAKKPITPKTERQKKKLEEQKRWEEKRKAESTRKERVAVVDNAMSLFYRSNSQQLNKSHAYLPNHMNRFSDEEIINSLERNHPKNNRAWIVRNEQYVDLAGNVGHQRYVKSVYAGRRPRNKK